MSRKATALMLGLVILLAATVTAAATAKSDATVSLRLSAPNENRAQWEAMIANFERVNPSIDIQGTFVPFAQQDPLLLTQFQAGTAPDLFTANVGGSSSAGLYAFGSQGRLADLSSSPWKKRVVDAARPYITVKQRIYGAPVGYSTSGLSYNVDLMQSLGVKPPTKFSELLDACAKIRAAGKIPIAQGMAGISHQIQFFVPILENYVYNLDPKWTVKRIQKKTTFASSPLWQRALQVIVDMRNANCFQPAPAGTTVAAAQGLIARGDAVMWVTNSADHAAVRAINPNINLNQGPFPADLAKDTVVGTGNGSANILVNKLTQHLKEARMFVDFVMRPAQARLFAKIGAGVSGDDLKAGILPKDLSADGPYMKAGKVVYSPTAGWPRPDKGLFIPTFVTLLPGLFTGQKTPAQILQDMDTAWDR